MSDAMRRLLEERWPLVRDEAQVQLAWLRAAVAADVEGVVGRDTEARKLAHQLRGRFGMYGNRAASEVAGEIEDRLVAATSTTGATLAGEIDALLDRLDALLVREPEHSRAE